MNTKIIKVVDYNNTWTSKKDGKERPSVRYYVVLVINGKEVWVAIKSAFDQQKNWLLLDASAELLVKKGEPNLVASDKQ